MMPLMIGFLRGLRPACLRPPCLRPERRLRGVRLTGLLLVMLTLMPPAAAQGASSAGEDFDQRLRTAEELLRTEAFAEAAEAYQAARTLRPDSARAAFGLGTARYRLREWAAAREAFRQAAELGDAAIAAAGTFNMGNSAYSEALELLQRLQDPGQEASVAGQPPTGPGGANPLELAKARLAESLGYFRDAVIANPADLDARANAQRAHRLLREIEQQEQQQQNQDQQNQDQQNQDQQNQDQQNQDQQSQDQQSQDQQKQEQKNQDQQNQDQQNQDQQNQDQQNQDQQNQNQQNQDQKNQDQQKQDQKNQDQQNQDQRNQDQKNQDQQDQDQKDQDQQNQDQNDQQDSQPPSEQQKAGKAGEPQVKEAPLTRDEVERLLQAVRDREKARRAKLEAQRQRRPMPAAKDW